MPEIEIELVFLRSGDDCIELVDFEAEGALVDTIEQHGKDVAEEKNDEIDEEDECTDKYEYVGFKISSYDDDIAAPSEFDNLDEYAAYCEQVEEHGEAYVLRHEDIGEFDFSDDYVGTYHTEEEYGEQCLEDFGDVPDHLRCYIDMEKYTRDMLMDYSSYEGSQGFHVFRNY